MFATLNAVDNINEPVVINEIPEVRFVDNTSYELIGGGNAVNGY